jgi:membrane-associated phospholipid phosphatase
LFLVVYGGCDWITAQRSDVAVFYFEWERHIPFVPFFVLPYLSIDLFFIGAPFLLRSEGELKVLAWRIACAILVAGVFFLVLPLRFAFARPQTGGCLGAVFGWFLALDAPFNLFPSLHAALCLLLVEVYAKKSNRLVRPFVLLWFGLIALSPLFTRQHHLVDILGGFLLAICCRAFISLPARPAPIDEPAQP